MEGTDRYFGWSLMFPKTPDTHRSLGYFEMRKHWEQSMAFELNGTDVKFTTRLPYAVRWAAKGVFTPGRWHDFVVHVLWSSDPAKGFVEVWFDGKQVVKRTATATLKDENPAFFQVGIFRDTSETPEAIFLDHVTEASTLAEVTPPRLAKAPKSGKKKLE